MDGDHTVVRQPVADQLLYSVPQAAHILGISPRLCWEYVRRGEIRKRHIGTRVLIHRTELQKFALRDHATNVTARKEKQGLR